MRTLDIGRPGPLADTIIECLQHEDPDWDRSLVSRVDYQPPIGSSDIALCCVEPPSSTSIEGLIARNPIVETAVLTGHYLNVQLARDLQFRPSWRPLERVSIAVEYGSAVPAYPITLETMRWIVVGEWISRSCEIMGAEVRRCSWIQDSARHLDLLREHIDAIVGSETPDLVAASCLSDELAKLDGAATRRAVDPHHGDRSASLGEPTQASDGESSTSVIASSVVRGWERTYAAARLPRPEFQLESNLGPQPDISEVRDLVSQVDPRWSTDSAHASYLDRNVWYFGWLLGRQDAVISVVPRTQVPLVGVAARAAEKMLDREPGAIRIIGVGATSVDGLRDSLRERRVTVADPYLADDVSVEAMIFRFLNARSWRDLDLRTDQLAGSVWSAGRGLDGSHPSALLDEIRAMLPRAIHDGSFTRLDSWLRRVEGAAPDDPELSIELSAIQASLRPGAIGPGTIVL